MFAMILKEMRTVNMDTITEEWKEESFVGLVDSLSNILTTYEVHGQGSEADSRCASAAMQNQDAQAEPVHSLAWARIASDMMPSFVPGTSSKAEVDELLRMLSSMIAKYNDRPEVQASAQQAMQIMSSKRRKSRGDEQDGEDLGILLGDKKAKTIQNFLLVSTRRFWDMITLHLHNYTFKNCGWSEKLLQVPSVWLGSTIQVDPMTISDAPPPEREANVLVNWCLPLNARAHEALAGRMHFDFVRAVACVANPEKRRQFRKSQAGATPTTLDIKGSVLQVSRNFQSAQQNMQRKHVCNRTHAYRHCSAFHRPTWSRSATSSPFGSKTTCTSSTRP